MSNGRLDSCADAREPGKAGLLRTLAREGRLAYRQTTLDEFKALLGPPTQESPSQSGSLERVSLTYPGVEALFVRDSGQTAPPILLYVTTDGPTPRSHKEGMDIGQERLLVARSEQVLERLDSWWGLKKVSLAALDLRGKGDLLRRLPFDTDTVWPGSSQLPSGFDPHALLRQGRNPGLGVRGLHARGIDGREISVAVIDQPLVVDHEEYADRITKHAEPGVEDCPPQMHGPAVASIAVGRTCGVAPRAALHYYAMPMWAWHSCRPYQELIERILAMNEGAADSQRVRVVSISMGMFSLGWEGFPDWHQTVERAAAEGVLVVTCDQSWLEYGTLQRRENADPDDPTGYVRGTDSGPQDALYVPAGNRTRAGHEHQHAYTYDRIGGLSWAAPYLAGLAALAFQVNPDVDAASITKLWQQSASKTSVGPIINPAAFLAAVQAA